MGDRVLWGWIRDALDWRKGTRRREVGVERLGCESSRGAVARSLWQKIDWFGLAVVQIRRSEFPGGCVVMKCSPGVGVFAHASEGGGDASGDGQGMIKGSTRDDQGMVKGWVLGG